MKTLAALLASLWLCSTFATAEEKYDGPRPPKPDIPYLVHADNLIETEVGEAREEHHGKSDVTYIIPGANSPVRTPLAEPIFLFEAEKISPESIGLYRMEVRKGNREVVTSEKRRMHPLRLMVTPLGGHLYRIEVNENLGLENGEYSLSPQGSNAVWCFQVY